MFARKADGCTFQNCADENINRSVHFSAEHFGVSISTICDCLRVRKLNKIRIKAGTPIVFLNLDKNY